MTQVVEASQTPGGGILATDGDGVQEGTRFAARFQGLDLFGSREQVVEDDRVDEILLGRRIVRSPEEDEQTNDHTNKQSQPINK